MTLEALAGLVARLYGERDRLHREAWVYPVAVRIDPDPQPAAPCAPEETQSWAYVLHPAGDGRLLRAR